MNQKFIQAQHEIKKKEMERDRTRESVRNLYKS